MGCNGRALNGCKWQNASAYMLQERTRSSHRKLIRWGPSKPISAVGSPAKLTSTCSNGASLAQLATAVAAAAAARAFLFTHRRERCEFLSLHKHTANKQTDRPTEQSEFPFEKQNEQKRRQIVNVRVKCKRRHSMRYCQ